MPQYRLVYALNTRFPTVFIVVALSWKEGRTALGSGSVRGVSLATNSTSTINTISDVDGIYIRLVYLIASQVGLYSRSGSSLLGMDTQNTSKLKMPKKIAIIGTFAQLKLLYDNTASNITPYQAPDPRALSQPKPCSIVSPVHSPP
jgi:hypothetical protein